jgi:dienelactone hydrolase
LLLTACSAAQAPPAPLTSSTSPSQPSPSQPSQPQPGTGPPAAPALGVPGSYRVAQRWLTIIEPAHTGVTGTPLGPRSLLTQIRYPVSAGSGRTAVPGRLPLLVFAPGFMQCGAPYARLLTAWASAGYVVAVVNFPHSDCKVGAAATESDMVNQPGDMSRVITVLLRRSASNHGAASHGARPAGFLSGVLDPAEIAVAGQSDGGDTVAALAASTCCTDHRVAAVAVLSGAEWPPMPGRYFSRAPVPMLFTQGSADTLNPPGCSSVMYLADPARARFYLALAGASHTMPYWGANRYERVTARVTIAFFDRYVLGRAWAGPLMRRAGHQPGLARLLRAGHGRFSSTYCNT